MLDIGSVLENKYRITGLLGKGAWGSVYLAEHLQLGNLWAVKVIDLSRQSRVNLLAEPDILKKLNHPSLPRIVDILQLDGYLYIIEDYFAGVSLKELINSREVCTEENALYWGRQLGEILRYLHNQQPRAIIYRDLKPGNIIIDDHNQARLIDFGVAREYKAEQEDDTVYIGTRGYAAPEQYAGTGQTDSRADIYGLGATLYHVLTGVSPNQPPYQLVPIRQLNPAVSARMESIIAKCMALDPKDRYQTAEELLRDLYLTGQTTSLRRGFLNLGDRNYMTAEPQVVVLERPLGTIVIGVCSTNRGVGCTHTALALGAFLTRKKHKVAVVEINDHPVFYALAEADTPQGRLPGSWRIQGMDLYKVNFGNLEHQLLEVLRAGYDYVVLDAGKCLELDEYSTTLATPGYGEIGRANVRILVAGSALWQLKDLAPYLQKPEQWQIIFRTPEPKLFQELQQELSYPIYASALHTDPFQVNPDQERLFAQVLNNYLPQEKPRRNPLLFWK